VLTDKKVRQAKPKEQAYRITDGLGLYLMVTPAGGKLWRWKYRFQGVEKLMTFGKYPDVPIDAARGRRDAARGVLASGADPMEKRKAEKVAAALEDKRKFGAVGALWHEHWRVDKSAQHIDATRRRLEANVYPHLGERPIDEIKTPELVRMVKAIEARGVGDLARRALETTGQIFRYGVAHGYCERNPCADIKPGDVLKPTRSRNLARVDATALPALLRAIEVYQGKVVTRLSMKLMALTFVRTSELIGARWDEFDFATDPLDHVLGIAPMARWNIPAERMKMKTPHIVPLATQTIEVLELLRTVTGRGELLFPGDVDRRKTMSNNTILEALDRMGYGGIMTGHGFRGLASTLLHEQGWPHEHIELQLAHAPRNAVSAAYNHALYLEPRAKMMQAWGDYLEKLQRKVVSIRGEVA
jgi:integrase